MMRNRNNFFDKLIAKYPKLAGAVFVVLMLMASTEMAKAIDHPQTNNLKQVGQATAYWASFIPVYDASLMVSENTNRNNLLAEDTAIELQLCYRTSLTADDFIEAAQQALPNPLPTDIQLAVDRLHQAYEGVKPSDCYQLVYHPETGTELRLNQTLKFQDQTPGFKATYFGIWLGNKPLSKEVKSKLMGAL